jgi:hypothetical protein
MESLRLVGLGRCIVLIAVLFSLSYRLTHRKELQQGD